MSKIRVWLGDNNGAFVGSAALRRLEEHLYQRKAVLAEDLRPIELPPGLKVLPRWQRLAEMYKLLKPPNVSFYVWRETKHCSPERSNYLKALLRGVFPRAAAQEAQFENAHATARQILAEQQRIRNERAAFERETVRIQQVRIPQRNPFINPPPRIQWDFGQDAAPNPFRIDLPEEAE